MNQQLVELETTELVTPGPPGSWTHGRSVLNIPDKLRTVGHPNIQSQEKVCLRHYCVI